MPDANTMTPDEIAQWLQQNGGPGRTEGPDAHGVTIYHSANGPYVSVRANGTVALRGFEAPKLSTPADLQHAAATGGMPQPVMPVALSSTPPPGGGAMPTPGQPDAGPAAPLYVSDPTTAAGAAHVYTADGKVYAAGPGGALTLIGNWDTSRGQPSGTIPAPEGTPTPGAVPAAPDLGSPEMTVRPGGATGTVPDTTPPPDAAGPALDPTATPAATPPAATPPVPPAASTPKPATANSAPNRTVSIPDATPPPAALAAATAAPPVTPDTSATPAPAATPAATGSTPPSGTTAIAAARSAALDPDGERSAQWIEDPKDADTIQIPSGVTIGPKNGQYYVRKRALNDGRIVYEWYKRGSGGGPDGKGDKVDQTTQGVDTRQRDTFNADVAKAQATAKTPPEERNNAGRRERWNADTQKWDDVGAAIDEKAGPAGRYSAIEGTKNPDGTYDNRRPSKVIHNADGSIFSSEELTGADLEAWQLQQQRVRNGGLTDKETQDRADKQKAEAEGRTDRNQPDTKTESVTGSDGKTYIRVVTVPKDGSAPTIRQYGPDGKTVDTIPGHAPSTIKEDPNNPGGFIEITTDDKGNPVAKPVRGEGMPSGRTAVNLPALHAEAGKLSDEAKSVWEDLNGRVQRGEITRSQAKDEFESRYAILQARLSEIKSVVDMQSDLAGQALTERQQDLTDIQGRRTAGTSAATLAGEYARTSMGTAGTHAPSLSKAMQEIIDMSYETQKKFGGTATVAPVDMGKARTQAQGLGLPGFPAPGGTDSAPPVSGAAPATAGAPPAGAPALTPLPGAAGASGAPPPAAGGAPLAPDINPATPPTGAQVEANKTGVMDASQAAFGGLGIGPGAGGSGAAPANPPPTAGPALTPTQPPLPLDRPSGGGGGVQPIPNDSSGTAGAAALDPMASGGSQNDLVDRSNQQGTGPEAIMSSLLELSIPGVGTIKIKPQGAAQGAEQSGTDMGGMANASAQKPAAAPQQPQQQTQQSKDPDLMSSMESMGKDDPSWQAALQEVKRRNQTPSPQTMFA